jgi:hypothetical protein
MKVHHVLIPLFAVFIFTTCAAESSLSPNPGAAGLWVGEVTLREVTFALANTNAPTADQAQIRVILHVSSNGVVRLLKDVIIAQKTGAANSNSVILITDSKLLPGVTGVVRRGGKLVGRRLATAAYDFTGNELLLTGGLGENFRCNGSLTLPSDHATNPFRHQYHPDHSQGFEITRNLGLSFSQPMSNVNGVDQLTGVYEESIAGLHKTALTTKGTVVLNRISNTAVLNQ